MAHDATHHFDAEDVRLLTSLSAFASAGLQVTSALEIEQTIRVRCGHEARTKTLAWITCRRQQSATAKRRYPPYRRMAVQRLLEKLPQARIPTIPMG